ncbi:hypothetical protein MTR67_038331 [Solanum verrucosum]|uniref:Integrase catalytic domain-containing protein n=1 Tax=Solanum verrucosum TaxID=315347 RepID=A0AAF0UG38_SOLVR|nr:hypothetical protein MTR67_038331 [Solanum verrucosum]
MQKGRLLAWESCRLDRDVQRLANSLVRLQIIEETGGLITFIEAHSFLVEKINDRQFDDEKLCLIRDNVVRGENNEVFLDSEGVWRIRGRICVSNVERYCRFCFHVLDLSKVKCEHQRSGGISQGMYIPTWKWKRITVDFDMGLPAIVGDYDSICIVVDRLTKSAYFIQVRVKYTIDKLAQLYISQIVRLHGVSVSIVSH